MSLQNINVVLVEPAHPGNIGAAARAMKTMGLHRLALVNPARFPDPQAEWRAAGAADVIDNCQVFPDLGAAIAPCRWVVGTSARQRRIPWPAGEVREVTAELARHAADGEVAVVFGRETNGLSNEELQRCNRHLQIPSAPEYPSLNLAMAVQVVAYEIYRHTTDAPRAPSWDRKPATAGEVEALLAHFGQVLTETQFIDAANPGQSLTRLRRLFARLHLDETEVGMLRGILSHLADHRRPAK